MQKCSPGEKIPIVKRDKYSAQTPKIDIKNDSFKYIPYASIVDSLKASMYSP